MRRRDFLAALAGVGVAGAAGAVALSRIRSAGATGVTGAGVRAMTDGAWSAPGPVYERWGVQLYTVRSAMAENVPSTLAAVSEMGYGEVEFAGLFGRSAPEMRAILDGVGLKAASGHVGMVRPSC